jgi:MoxR-like ATPase
VKDEPMKEIRDVCPTSLSKLVGQRSVIDQLTVALDASFADGRKMDDCLLVGGPGLGKSQIASIIAQELAADFQEVLGQSIQTPADLNTLLLSAKHKSVIHIDETHEMDRKFQTALYLAIDKRTIFLNGGKNIQSIPIADFTLLLSTTDKYCLLQPLRDRMKLVLRFQFYTNEELTQLLLYRIRGLQWDVHEQILPLDRTAIKGDASAQQTLFYTKRQPISSPVAKRSQPKERKQKGEQYVDLIADVEALRQSSVKAAQVEEAVRILYPQGITQEEYGEVVRNVFLHLQRKDV